MADVNFMRAASAYNDALRTAQNIINRVCSGDAAPATESVKGTSFLDMVGGGLKAAAESGYKSELTATRAISGKADLTDVVTAISDAETSLNTVVAIRDRVISAYQDIIKMPI